MRKHNFTATVEDPALTDAFYQDIGVRTRDAGVEGFTLTCLVGDAEVSVVTYAVLWEAVSKAVSHLCSGHGRSVILTVSPSQAELIEAQLMK